MTTSARVRTISAELAEIVGARDVLHADDVGPDYGHDEALHLEPVTPMVVVRPSTAEQVAALLRYAGEHAVPVTARGSGTGLSGAARPLADGMVISFENMAEILEIDVDNQVAVVQPGVGLAALDEAAGRVGLMYSVYPGELSASIGGTVGTNAGGMRAVKYGVTRHNVLGLQAALATGALIRTGGAIAKVSTGYDLTQLIIGSEGTLALATEVTVKLHPRLAYSATILAPFATVDEVVEIVPSVIATGCAPVILEYIDAMTMASITHSQDLALGIPDALRDSAQAYLVVSLENRDRDRLDGDIELLGSLVAERGALDSFVLDGGSARALITAREKAFWTAKAAGADDIIDMVVPRTAMPVFLTRSRELATAAGGAAIGCGHAGDGNVHLAIFCPDAEARRTLLHDIFALGMGMGGAISGEHGVGRAKSAHFAELTDPEVVAVMREIKRGFDPAGILNPGVLFGEGEPG